MQNAIQDRGLHILTKIPMNISELQISRSFFHVLQLDDSFLSIPVHQWPDSESFQQASNVVGHLACVNDCAERGVALIQNFSDMTKDETKSSSYSK